MTWPDFVLDVTEVSAWWSRSKLKTRIDDSMHNVLMNWCSDARQPRLLFWGLYIFPCAWILGIQHTALLWTSSCGGSCISPVTSQPWCPWRGCHPHMLNKNFIFTAEVLNILRLPAPVSATRSWRTRIAENRPHQGTAATLAEASPSSIFSGTEERQWPCRRRLFWK